MIPRNAVGEIIPVLLATRIAVPDSERKIKTKVHC